MKFGIFYEHQLPRPWAPDDEHRMMKDALDQVELADRLGIDFVWEVEHHFLDEYSHSSAPEVFLAAASQRTSRIRLGHGIIPLPVPYNHPARVAERVSTLDLVSNGRVEFGTGESSTVAELDGFRVDPGEKRAQWEEATRAALRCMIETPFTGLEGKYISMPPRNVVPKPVQKPHPPLWLACTRPNTTYLAAELGMGALGFSFVSPEDMTDRVVKYYETFEERCVPLGYEVFAGNRTDVTTVQEIVETMEERYGTAERIWVMDRGMTSRKNLGPNADTSTSCSRAAPATAAASGTVSTTMLVSVNLGLPPSASASRFARAWSSARRFTLCAKA